MSVPAQESAPRRKHRSGEFLLTASMRFEYTAAHCLGPQNDAVDGLLSFDWPRRSEQACGAFLFLGSVPAVRILELHRPGSRLIPRLANAAGSHTRA